MTWSRALQLPRHSLAMPSLFSHLSTLLFLLVLLAPFSTAHLVLTYPGWRGDTLHSNGTTADSHGLGRGPNNTFPYGMGWEYPCGGLPTTTNRTKWPVTGGAVGFEPAWFQGHKQSQFYINLGQGTSPPNMSLNSLGPIGWIGPSNEAYPDQSICMPQVPLPPGYQANIGDNATLQVVMIAQHGAALYGCVDITFADPANVNEVNKSNCQNTSEITFTTVFTATSLSSDASPMRAAPTLLWLPVLAVVAGLTLI